MSTRRIRRVRKEKAVPLPPLLLRVIHAARHAPYDPIDRAGHDAALRELGRWALVYVPSRGVLAPAEDHAYKVIQQVAMRHLAYQNERYTADVAAAIARRPGWAVVVFPAIPLGSNGGNEIGGRFPFPGTYAVRPETLRAIFMDLGAEFGEQGFRWIFLIHMHGAPDHNQALDDAGEYYRDVYGGRMINLAGLDTGSDPGVEAMKANASKEAVDEEGVGGHASLLETSRVMAVRPDLVPSSVASAPSVCARDLPELFRLAARPDWPGYVGAPRHAKPDLGRRIFEADAGGLVSIALRLLDGEADERKTARLAALAENPDVAKVLERSKDRNATIAKRQQEWIATHRRP